MKTDSDFVSAYGSSGMAVMRLASFFALIAILVPAQLIYSLFDSRDPFRLSRLFHRMLMKSLAFRIRVHGALTSSSPTLFLANHASYLDIPVLSTLIPASFVAKSEVAGWPLIGFLAKLQRTVFIERRSIRAEEQRGILRAQLENKHNLIIFPEGTSTDGLKALPFKSSLFSIVEEGLPGMELTVQPVSITCTEIGGVPITRAGRPFYAWYGDMTLVGHLWNVFKLGHFTVDVIFHPAVQPQSFADRKALARYCHQQVSRGIEQCLKGREEYNLEPVQALPQPA